MASESCIAFYFYKYPRAVCLFCVVLFGSLYSVRAVLTMALKEARWSVFTFEDKPANQFLHPFGDTDIIQVDTDKSVSIAYLPFVKKT